MMKLDSMQTAFLTQELEDIDQQQYEELIPGLLSRTYIPDITGIPEWAKTHSYDMWSLKGKMKFGASNADDAPRSTATKQRASRNIKPIEGSYAWTYDEIQAAAGTGVPLDRMTVLAARTSCDQEIDGLLAVGNADYDIEGLLTLSDLDLVTLAAAGAWSTKTPDQMMADVNKLVQSRLTALKQATNVPGFNRFTLLLPTEQEHLIAMTPRSSTSDTTVKEFLLGKSRYLEAIEPWDACNGAGAAVPGTTDRMVLYPRNPLWGGAMVPREFTQLGPQERNTEIVVPTLASCGGVMVRYPVAGAYMDGI